MSPQDGGGGHSKRLMSAVSGLGLLSRVVWHRGKAGIKRTRNSHDKPRTPPAQPYSPLPPELVEMIIKHLIHDIQALKVCSLTCYSWYIIAAPHIHHTLVLGGNNNGNLKPLSNRRALGLLPFVKEVRILRSPGHPGWFRPQLFKPWNSSHFSVLTNVQSLEIQDLDISKFISKLHRYFGHFSSTLRSLTLETLRCTPQELRCFISLFPNLDDLELEFSVRRYSRVRAPIPYRVPRLRGQLTLSRFYMIEIWRPLAASRSLQFRSIHLRPVSSCAPVLFSACAETLETLRIEPQDEVEWFDPFLIQNCDLSSLKVLRSLQIDAPPFLLQLLALQEPQADFLTPVESIFRTVTSPVFSEFVIIIQCGRKGDVYHFPWTMYDTLRRMHDLVSFELVFLLVGTARCDEVVACRTWERGISMAADGGLLSFLRSPPSIRFTRRGKD